jgi:hypothetical protein
MDAHLYAEHRQRELLAVGESLRLGRLASLARRCAEACRPSAARRALAALRGRDPQAVGC